ncbi:hypothetical protein JZ751_019169 [Albula glossodonta]|uniref:Uncharacterized protein n=1 Tax=Albula glossodonta TaxID=121402 RepID=A0A8T2MW11_9TELE|nr:hypothetical protein JZ751_019169 [Albula glossodonta]
MVAAERGRLPLEAEKGLGRNHGVAHRAESILSRQSVRLVALDPDLQGLEELELAVQHQVRSLQQVHQQWDADGRPLPALQHGRQVPGQEVQAAVLQVGVARLRGIVVPADSVARRRVAGQVFLHVQTDALLQALHTIPAGKFMQWDRLVQPHRDLPTVQSGVSVSSSVVLLPVLLGALPFCSSSWNTGLCRDNTSEWAWITFTWSGPLCTRSTSSRAETGSPQALVSCTSCQLSIRDQNRGNRATVTHITLRSIATRGLDIQAQSQRLLASRMSPVQSVASLDKLCSNASQLSSHFLGHFSGQTDTSSCFKRFILLQTLHPASDTSSCFRHFILLQTLHPASDTSNTSSCFRHFEHFILLQTLHPASDTSSCFKRFILLQTLHPASDTSNTSSCFRHFKHFILLQTLHPASDTSSCFKRFILLQTLHPASDTSNTSSCFRHFKHFILLQTLHPASNASSCFKHFILLQTLHPASDTSSCFKRFILLQTLQTLHPASDTSDTSSCFKHFILLQTLHPASNASSCFKHFILLQTLQTLHPASDTSNTSSCFKHFILLQTLHPASNTSSCFRHFKRFILLQTVQTLHLLQTLQTLHPASNTSSCFRHFILLQTLHPASDTSNASSCFRQFKHFICFRHFKHFTHLRVSDLAQNGTTPVSDLAQNGTTPVSDLAQNGTTPVSDLAQNGSRLLSLRSRVPPCPVHRTASTPPMGRAQREERWFCVKHKLCSGAFPLSIHASFSLARLPTAVAVGDQGA